MVAIFNMVIHWEKLKMFVYIAADNQPIVYFFSFPSVPESPRLSSRLSSSKPDLAHDDSGPECCGRPCAEPVDGDSERPVSLVSTLSSGSSRDSRSLFGSTTALPSSATPPAQSEEDIDLELSPAEGATEQPGQHSPTLAGSRGCWQARLDSGGVDSQWDDSVAACNRKGSVGVISHIQTSPVIADTMAPNPKLTYVDRVVMEIIETERMYVKDLRSIVEVSECLPSYFNIAREDVIQSKELCEPLGSWPSS